MDTLDAAIHLSGAPITSDADALFKEARRRRRNRRLIGAGTLLLIVALVALVTQRADGGGDVNQPAVPLTQPAFGDTVLASTTAAGGATFTLVDQSPLTGCTSGSVPNVVTDKGMVSFSDRRLSHSTVDASCSARAMRSVDTTTAHYQLLGPDVAVGVGTTAFRPWLRTSVTLRTPMFSVADTMLEPDLTVLLTAIRNPLSRGPTMVVDGVTATVYHGSTTLALLEGADPNFSTNQPADAVPSAQSIVIPLRIWLDRDRRIVRVIASEPVFAVSYADGSSASGPQVELVGSQIPPAGATTTPRLLGESELTLSYTDFGPKSVPLPAAAATVTAGS